MLWRVASLLVALSAPCVAILSVQENEYRFLSQLDGLWAFVMEPKNSNGVGFQNEWYLLDISRFENATVMPVPAAYNDIGSDTSTRDHVGWVWYQTSFFSTQRDRDLRRFLRFSSVNYYAEIYLNKQKVGTHVGGHLPFEFEITGILSSNVQNWLTVAVNNTLSSSTIPPGEFVYMQRKPGGLQQYPPGFFKQSGNFDFFNYAGILRSVYLVKKSPHYVQDIKIEAEYSGNFTYEVITDPPNSNVSILITVNDEDGNVVFKSIMRASSGYIPNVQAWWPRTMGDPTLYTFQVWLVKSDHILDVYRLRFGFRTVSYSSDQIFINGKPFYCHGFGMHEDFELHGRGYNAVVMTKDLNMLEWMSGNCYRTSHYPYSEERAMEADRRGIAVITETPAVGLGTFTKANEQLHMQMIQEMVERDRNHPSTIIWSLANEPRSAISGARSYFGNLVTFTKSIDKTRPVTIVFSSTYDKDQAADLVDLICVNRYYGWYHNVGYIETINGSWVSEIMNWKRKYNKAVIISEYGAEAIPGLNQEPSRVFSEQYQRDVLKATHAAFDVLRSQNLIAGEMIWNFADFMTAQDITRPLGNHKGVLTRTRQAKISAYVIKERYEMLTDEEQTCSETDKCTA